MSLPIALVCGASGGIGSSLVRQLSHSKRYRVLGTCRRPAAVLPTGLELLPLELGHGGAIDCFVERLGETLGSGTLTQVYLLAGECVMAELLEDDPRTLRRLFEINVVSQLELLQALRPYLEPRARIVVAGSLSARFAWPLLGAYAASKAALARAIEAVAQELPKEMRCTYAELGNVRTPLWNRSLQQLEAQAGATGNRRLYEAALHLWEKAMPSDDAARKLLRLAERRRPALTVRLGRDARINRFLVEWLPRWVAHGHACRLRRGPKSKRDRRNRPFGTPRADQDTAAAL